MIKLSELITFKKVADLQADHYTITQSVEETQFILDLLGFSDEVINEFGCLITWQHEGDYKEIWGLSNSIPYLELNAQLIYLNGEIIYY